MFIKNLANFVFQQGNMRIDGQQLPYLLCVECHYGAIVSGFLDDRYRKRGEFPAAGLGGLYK